MQHHDLGDVHGVLRSVTGQELWMTFVCSSQHIRAAAEVVICQLQ
jgi:hypothetical protein